MRIDLPDEADPSNVITIEEVEEWRRKFQKKDACEHRRIQVSAAEIVVTCLECGERLSTNAWLVEHRVNVWARVRNMYARNQETLKKIAAKERVRCQHCNRITGTTRDERLKIVREDR